MASVEGPATVHGVSAGVYNIKLEKGVDTELPFLWGSGTPFVPYVVTGYTARMQWRATIGADVILAEFNTTNGKIIVDGPAGKFTLVISAAESALWTFTFAVYDLEIISSTGKVKRLVRGEVELDPEVTR